MVLTKKMECTCRHFATLYVCEGVYFFKFTRPPSLPLSRRVREFQKQWTCFPRFFLISFERGRKYVCVCAFFPFLFQITILQMLMEINIWKDIYALIMGESALCPFSKERRKKKQKKKKIFLSILQTEYSNSIIRKWAYRIFIINCYFPKHPIQWIPLQIKCVIFVFIYYYYYFWKELKRKIQFIFDLYGKAQFDSLERRHNTPPTRFPQHRKYDYISIELIYWELQLHNINYIKLDTFHIYNIRNILTATRNN